MKSKQAALPALILLGLIASLPLSACGQFPFISPPTPFPSYQNNSMPPLFTSPDQATFTIGETGAFTITVSGSPLPGLATTGDLPAGLSLSPTKDGQAILSGIPGRGTAGKYPLGLKARNGFLPDAEQVLNLLIVKANTAMDFALPTQGFQYGTAGSITVTVTSQSPLQGAPTGSIALSIDNSTTVSSPLVDGKAIFDCASLPVGKHTLQASYAGDETFAPDQSSAAELSITPPALRIFLPVISNP
jgi:hypothetical protein